MAVTSIRTLATRRIGAFLVEAAEGDIASADVDAVTNAANDHLWMGAGVAGAIKRKAGAVVEEEAIAKGPIPVGDAVETGAGALSAKYVIHSAVMGQDLRTDLHIVAKATRSVLELAQRLGVTSLALPLFGTGVGGLDTLEVASTMLGAVRAAAFEDGTSGMRVVMVAWGDAAARDVKKALDALPNGYL